jgi:threonine dehydratase
LRYISERTEIGEKREAIFAVEIPEQPGAYAKFCEDLGRRNITEFNYRYTGGDTAHIFVGVQVSHGGNGRAEVIETLQSHGYRVEDLTDNEMAKLHIRYMVGGRKALPDNGENTQERVYRFQFPERPGALVKFLNRLAGRWNISMFHYRNHGSAFGRVLVAMQIPEDDLEAAQVFFSSLEGYRFWDETDNPAYQLFLS